MGNLLGYETQAKELRVIYLYDANTETTYPIKWPLLFVEFISALHEIFPQTKNKTSQQFFFDDAGDELVCITCQSSFEALIPQHKSIDGKIDVYYVSLDSWA